MNARSRVQVPGTADSCYFRPSSSGRRTPTCWSSVLKSITTSDKRRTQERGLHRAFQVQNNNYSVRKKENDGCRYFGISYPSDIKKMYINIAL